jgi:hypothetical protein
MSQGPMPSKVSVCSVLPRSRQCAKISCVVTLALKVPSEGPRFHVHFTPEGASWINLVDRFFAELTNKQIRRGSHRSTTELERCIRDYLRVYNVNPKPFVWTKTADAILASVSRFCRRIFNSGH